MQATKFLVLLALAMAATVSGSPNVPVWELLTHQEKMGRLMYVFIHLVDSYCKGSTIPDCNKVLTLYGMSNLVNEDDSVLERLDPYQRNSRIIIWEKVMRGDFKLPPNKSFYSNHRAEEVRAEEDYDYVNEVDDSPSSYQVNRQIHKLRNDPHPYAVRIPAPAKIAAAHATKIGASHSVKPSFEIVDDNKIANSAITASGVASNSAKSSFGIVDENIADNSGIAVGSSHPYAVKVFPVPITSEPIPVGIKASGDYEPMMMESQVHETHALPPTLTILKRKRRTAGDEFPEEEMQSLLLQVLNN